MTQFVICTCKLVYRINSGIKENVYTLTLDHAKRMNELSPTLKLISLLCINALRRTLSLHYFVFIFFRSMEFCALSDIIMLTAFNRKRHDCNRDTVSLEPHGFLVYLTIICRGC